MRVLDSLLYVCRAVAVIDGRTGPVSGCVVGEGPEANVLTQGFDGFGPGESPLRTLSPMEGPFWVSPLPEVFPGLD